MGRNVSMYMEEIGGGHKMPANAIKDSMIAMDPSLSSIPLLELSAASGAEHDGQGLKDIWNYLLERPDIARPGSRVLNYVPNVSRTVFRRRYSQYLERGVEYFREARPEFVFSTYFGSSMVAAEAREIYGLDMKIVSLCTDPFDANALWIEPRVDSFIVCSYEARRVALRRGFPEEKIHVFPFPINNKFFTVKKDKAAIRAELGLSGDRTVLLATAGGMGRGVMADYILSAYRKEYPLDIVFVCGRNTDLANELTSTLDPEAPTRVKVLGFVNNMNELIKAADVLVAKAGASTTFEALLSGTPILYTDWAAYNEKPNIDFALKHNAGWFVGSEREFLKLAHRLATTDLAARFREGMKCRYMYSGADDIARYLIREAAR